MVGRQELLGAGEGVYSLDILFARPLLMFKKLEARCAGTNFE